MTVLCSEGQYDNVRAQLPDLCHPRRRRERPAVCAFQAETGHYVGRLEELAFNQGWLTEEQVHKDGQELGITLYGQYLQCL